MVTIICTNFGTCITKCTIDTLSVIFYQFVIMQTGSRHLQITPLILNTFWLNLLHAYKIQFWSLFAFCVVFKCPYFWSYSRKTDFWPFYTHLSMTVNHSKIVRLTRLFSTGSCANMQYIHTFNVIFWFLHTQARHLQYSTRGNDSHS